MSWKSGAVFIVYSHNPEQTVLLEYLPLVVGEDVDKVGKIEIAGIPSSIGQGDSLVSFLPGELVRVAAPTLQEGRNLNLPMHYVNVSIPNVKEWAYVCQRLHIKGERAASLRLTLGMQGKKGAA